MNNDHFVSLHLLSQFRKVKELTNSVDDVMQACDQSSLLELDPARQMVRAKGLRVFECRTLRVIGMQLIASVLHEMLSQYVDISSVKIHTDFMSPPKPGSFSWIIRCNDEQIAQTLCEKLKDSDEIFFAEILRENLLKNNSSAQSMRLKATAAPFVPSSQKSRRGEPDPKKSASKKMHNRFPRHANRKNSTKQSPSDRSKPDGSVEAQPMKNHAQKRNNQHNNQFRRRNYKDRNGFSSTSKPSTKQIARGKRDGSKKSAPSYPVPSLSANNYPSLSGKKDSDDFPSDNPQQRVPKPGDFSFAEVATKARDIAPKKTVVPSSATSSENSSVKSQGEVSHETKGSREHRSSKPSPEKKQPEESQTKEITEGQSEPVESTSTISYATIVAQ